MKTYEEMARDVLKRRDEELQKAERSPDLLLTDEPSVTIYPASGKRRLFPKIAIPCAAAVTAAAVGITVWHNVPLGSDSVNKTGNELTYINSKFEERPSVIDDPDIIVDNDPMYMDYSDVYRGGSTEINYNDIGDFNPYMWFYMNSAEPTYNDRDFVSVSDINLFYGIKFDRLNEVLGEGTHDPYGYHTQDVEIDGVVEHSLRGYYNTNSISYIDDDDGLGDFTVTVSASFGKQLTAASVYADAPEAAKNPTPSVINGFNALVYNYSGQLLTEIDMNGVYVTIAAAPTDGVYRDPDAFTLFKKIYESYLTSYTAPLDGSEDWKPFVNKMERLHIDDDIMFEVMEDKIKIPSRTDYDNDGAVFVQYSPYMLNKRLGIELDRFGRIHSDWRESWYYDAGVYKSGEKMLPSVNTVAYEIPVGTMTVSAITLYPEIEDVKFTSTINGLPAAFYVCPDDTVGRFGNTDEQLSAVVNMKGVLVWFFYNGGGITEDSFAALVKEFTAE